MLFVDERRQHGYPACVVRRQHKPALRRSYVCQRPELHAKTPYFDPQACAIRFIGVLPAEGACNERGPWHIGGPRFAKCA
jgi:hypothetical protein